MIVPKCKPGQILIRKENDEWVCIWPKHTYEDLWYCGFVSMLCLTLFTIAGALYWFGT